MLPRIYPVNLTAGGGDATPGARPRLAARRRRDRDRRPAPVARGLARVAHPLAVVRARRRADGAQADLRGRLAPAGRDRPARAASPDALDAAVRAAGSLAVHFARKTGCSLLMPGDRRASVIEHDLLSWPALHVRLALMDDRAGPSLAAAQNRRGLVLYVAARPVDRAPRGLGRTPGRLPDRRPGRARRPPRDARGRGLLRLRRGPTERRGRRRRAGGRGVTATGARDAPSTPARRRRPPRRRRPTSPPRRSPRPSPRCAPSAARRCCRVAVARAIAFVALAAWGALHWMSMLEPAEPRPRLAGARRSGCSRSPRCSAPAGSRAAAGQLAAVGAICR